MLNQLKGLQSELTEIQGETPLILPSVDRQAVASVVGDWTGIPVGRMVKDEIETVLKLTDTLSQRVIGQDHALDMIAKRIQTSRASTGNGNQRRFAGRGHSGGTVRQQVHATSSAAVGARR